MADKQDKNPIADMAVTKAAGDVIEHLQSATTEVAEELGLFQIVSLWTRLAQRNHEIMEIIQERDMGEGLVRGLLEKYDDDIEEVRLFPLEMEFLVKSAMECNTEIQRRTCKKLNKSPQELDRIMKTEALASGADAEFVTKVIKQMMGQDDE